MLIGYARVSTDDQNLDLQRDALAKAGVEPDYLFEEQNAAATTENRPELQQCLRILRKGDVLVIWRLDRLGRSLKELIELSEKLRDRGVELRSLQDSIDTTTSTGKFMFHMLGALAEFERNLISERTKAGLAAARARGRRGGRKAKLSDKQVEMMVAAKATGEFSDPEVAAQFGISTASLYRILKDRRERLEAKQHPLEQAAE